MAFTLDLACWVFVKTPIPHEMFEAVQGERGFSEKKKYDITQLLKAIRLLFEDYIKLLLDSSRLTSVSLLKEDAIHLIELSRILDFQGQWQGCVLAITGLRQGGVYIPKNVGVSDVVRNEDNASARSCRCYCVKDIDAL